MMSLESLLAFTDRGNQQFISGKRYCLEGRICEVKGSDLLVVL